MKLPNNLRIMRAMPFLAAAGVALAASAVHARPDALAAETAGPTLQRPAWMTSPTNAALLYFRYWTMMPPDDERAIADAVTSLSEEERRTWVPSGEIAEKLASNASYFNGVTKATKLSSADWGIEYDDGFMALIPHLSQMRKSARIFDADARRLFAAGDSATASSRVAAIFRMADHSADGYLLISSLVGVAIANTGLQRVEAALDEGKLDKAGASTILAALRPLSGADPFEFKKCVEGEGWVVTGGLKPTFKGKSAGKDFASTMADLDSFSGDEGAKIRAKVEAFDQAALYTDLDRSSEFYHAVLAAWDKPDAMAVIGSLEKRLKDGEFGVSGQVVGPAFTKALTRSAEIRDQVKAVVARLEAVK